MTNHFFFVSMTPGWFLCPIWFSGSHMANYVLFRKGKDQMRDCDTQKRNIPEILTETLLWNLIPDIKVFISFVFFIRFSRCAFIIKILLLILDSRPRGRYNEVINTPVMYCSDCLFSVLLVRLLFEPGEFVIIHAFLFKSRIFKGHKGER